MDKNQVTGLILMSVLMLVWFYFFQPKPQEQVESQEPVVEAPTVQTPSPIEELVEQEEESDSVEMDATGPFSAMMNGKAEKIVIENDQVKYTFSNRGGIIREALLKEFFTADERELILMDEKSSIIKEEIETRYGKIDINEAIFKPTVTTQNAQGSDTLEISFKATLGNGKSIVKKYRIPGTGYRVFQTIDISGLNEELISQNVTITWMNNMKKFEKDLKTSQVKSTINYYTSLGDFDDLSESSSDFEEESISEMLKLVSFKQKLFTTGIVANAVFSGAYIATDPNSNNTETVKVCLLKTNVSLENYGQGFQYYYGPNNYQMLKKVADGFSKNIYLGWTPVNMVNKFLIIPTFNFLERYISNYGIIIILLVLFIKLLLSPLTYKSYISMAKTKVLKPELDAIKEQYGDDMQKVQSEQMTLYRQVGVNPISGCIPLLLQMPILFSMFYFFPNSIELRQ
jgi:YidC/Oxa1 family membrane protein insertase